MSDMNDPRHRAIYLLGVIGQFIDENNLEEYTTIFDDAECDGGCLAEDCAAAAEGLARQMESSK